MHEMRSLVVAETMHLLLQAAKPAAPSQLVARTFGTTQRAYTDFTRFHWSYLLDSTWVYLILLVLSCLIGCMWRNWSRKAASPETPLMHYTATQQASLKSLQVSFQRQAWELPRWFCPWSQATSSINHRIFYVNVVHSLVCLLFSVHERERKQTFQRWVSQESATHHVCWRQCFGSAGIYYVDALSLPEQTPSQSYMPLWATCCRVLKMPREYQLVELFRL